MLIVTPISIPVRFEGVTYKKGETFEMAEKDINHKHLKVVGETAAVKVAGKDKKKSAPSSKEA